jgi:ribonuclease-3
VKDLYSAPNAHYEKSGLAIMASLHKHKQAQAMLDKLQQVAGVSFSDPQLLITALTHPSYLAEHLQAKNHNQRLEYLGDAVLGLVVADFFYRRFPDEPEGQLTRMRATVVCESSLAGIARQLDLGSYLRLGHGEELSGGRQRASVLADALEALIGAVFLDQGWSEACRFLLLLLGENILTAARGDSHDYKTALQELVQQRGETTLVYSIIDETGPDHDKHFTAGVLWNGKLLGKGSGRSKKEAEQQAAKNAMAKLGQGASIL